MQKEGEPQATGEAEVGSHQSEVLLDKGFLFPDKRFYPLRPQSVHLQPERYLFGTSDFRLMTSDLTKPSNNNQ